MNHITKLKLAFIAARHCHLIFTDRCDQMIDYTTYRFLWPPRPERKIYELQLDWFESQGYWAQYKKNGTGNVMAISPQREVIAKQRTNKPHILWAPSAHTSDAFRSLKGHGWYVFVAELVHSKVANASFLGLRDINYINDILVADGTTLTGTTFTKRQELLADLFGASHLPVAKSGSHYVIDRHTWLARNHRSGFRKMFAGLASPEDEGLVLKQPAAKLSSCLRESSNSSWQVKIRVPHPNYDS
jgi:hypothetical protein